ncbi:hypothetical protein APASM_3242 [Actinosynnema pretiosum subsp. pretiosum]|nr:hypothetical protein APASM_3242 [Actinosynnema pretiosum subsp. pretiosum]
MGGGRNALLGSLMVAGVAWAVGRAGGVSARLIGPAGVRSPFVVRRGPVVAGACASCGIGPSVWNRSQADNAQRAAPVGRPLANPEPRQRSRHVPPDADSRGGVLSAGWPCCSQASRPPRWSTRQKGRDVRTIGRRGRRTPSRRGICAPTSRRDAPGGGPLLRLGRSVLTSWAVVLRLLVVLGALVVLVLLVVSALPANSTVEIGPLRIARTQLG